MKKPVVSICCITYNHALFIRQCIDGFLMQKPPSNVSSNAKMSEWCEILIHDDCSTDGTTEIIKEYATMYPDLIFPLYEEENQYSKGMAGKMSLFNYKRAKGTYIAYCEGDDYWTEPSKLQRQVDFLEANHDYSVCFHRCKHYNLSTDEYHDDDCGFLFQNGERGVDVSIDLFFKHWVTQPLTMVCRASMHDINLAYKYKYYRDMHEIYHLLKSGNGYLFGFVGGVYSKHTNGISSLISNKEQYTISYMLSKELYDSSMDSYTKLFFCDTLQWLIDVNAHIGLKSKFYFVFELFFVGGSFRRLLKNIFV